MDHVKMLSLHHVSKSFEVSKKKIEVLSDISLYVNKGEFVSIIGPSGSGKSTIFHIIGGLIEPSSGQVFLEGEEVTGQRGRISYMPQSNALFPWRNIEDNVILSQELAGIHKTIALEQAREWLERIGLADYNKEYPHVLSGGMQQRVAFLRTLLSPKELMCLDEPFGSLDALTRVEMQDWLLNIWEENKRSVLFVTHSIEEALYLSDRIYVLSQKPSSIISEVIVPFQRPRLSSILLQSDFISLRHQIYSLLRVERSR